MPDTSQPTATVCVLKVTLQRFRPAVWRRLEVPYGFSLGDLDVVIRTAFGWGDDHLHMFEVNGSQYGPGWTESPWMALIGRPRQDEDACMVGQVAGRVGAVLTYTYDLGDNWSHRVEVERVEDADPQRNYPACTAGSGLAPEEDTGEIRLGTFGAEAREEINHRLRRLPGAGLGSELDAGEAVDPLFTGLFPALLNSGGTCPCGCGETIEAADLGGLPMRRPVEASELAAIARSSSLLVRAHALVDWLGAGRAVTPSKVLRPELGRQAVAMLDGGWVPTTAKAQGELDLGLDDDPDASDVSGPHGRGQLVPEVRSSKELPSLHPVWMAALSAGWIEIRSGKAVLGDAGRRAADDDGDEQVVQQWTELAAGYLAAVYDTAAKDRGFYAGMLEELLPASAITLYTAARSPVPALVLGLAALDLDLVEEGLPAMVAMAAATGQYREVVEHWLQLGVVRQVSADLDPHPMSAGEQLASMVAEVRSRLAELASTGDPMVAALMPSLLEQLEQTPLIELTPLGDHLLGRLLTAHGWQLPAPGDSAGDAPSEILDRLAGYRLEDAVAESRVWLDAQGAEWTKALREAAWSAAVKIPDGARRRGALPILLATACAHEVRLLDQWQNDLWLGAHVAVTRQLLGGPEPTVAQQMWLAVDVLFADLGGESGDELDAGEVATSGLEELLEKPGGVQLAAATRHPEGRRVLLAAARHLGDPELSRRLRKALGSPRGGGRKSRRGTGLRITR